MDFLAIDLLRVHDEALSAWAREEAAIAARAPVPVAPEASGLGPGEATLRWLIEAEHRANFTIWHLEDQARRRDAGDAYVAAVKRAIDPWNQRRNDLMERVDEALLAALSGVDLARAELHSETAGMMIDRLSILALKIHSMNAIAASSARKNLAEACLAKASILREQRDDLVSCLQRLIEDFRAGRRYFKRYHQYKAYNDADLNPALRAAAGSAPPRSSRS